MDFQPYGKTADGKVINDVSGVSMKEYLDCLEETMARKHGYEAAHHVIENLVQKLNVCIPDPTYHVSESFLRTPWNSYSHEFSLFLTGYCSLLAEESDFHITVGHRMIPPMIRTLGRPFPVEQIFRQAANFRAKYVKAISFEPVHIEKGNVVLRIRYSESSLRQFGRYRNGCVAEICETIKAACASVPQAVHGLLPAIVKDCTCVANGDEYCEWHITWDEPTQRRIVWPLLVSGLAGSVTLFAVLVALTTWHPVADAFIALIPTLVAWNINNRRVAKRELDRRAKIIEDLRVTTDTRHEELRKAYEEEQQRTATLRKAYAEIEELNIGLETKVRQRTAELESANIRLRELDDLKSQFLAHVSHELRTPLTSIQGFAENLLRGLGGVVTDKQQQYLKRVTANSARLQRMISNLLDRSRIEAGRIQLSPAEVHLEQLLQDVVEHMQPLAEAKQQRIVLVCSSPGPMVWGDADKLRQIFINLVNNAIKYSPSQSEVRLEVSTDGAESARVSVIDQGKGIAPQAYSKVFQSFYREGSEAGRDVKGFGLGLSIVKTLIELHGGDVSIDSQEGKGTTFHVTLPVSQRLAGSASSRAGNVRRILVVDDDADIRQFLMDRLEASGYAVSTARSGREAIVLVSAEAFDGMILDIGLPEVSGLEVLRYLRSHNFTMSVLMITAAEGRERAVQALQTGAQAFLLKPFNSSQLERMMVQCFGARESPFSDTR